MDAAPLTGMLAAWRSALLGFLPAFTFCALALGVAASALPRAIRLPRAARFLFGFCVTPFFLGFSFLATAALLPGAPAWLHAGMPLALAAGLLLACRRTAFHLLRSVRRALRRQGAQRMRMLAMAVPLLLPVATVCYQIQIDSRSPIIAFDALQYLRQALPLAETRDASRLVDFRGSADGSLRGDIHHRAWPAYLGYALLYGSDEKAGYPFDQSARLAFQLCFLLMLLSVAAVCAAARALPAAALAICILLLVPGFDYIVNSFSRDAYRIVPLMLLAAVLVSMRPGIRLGGRRALWLCGAFLASALALVGHTLGGFVVVALTGSWAAWQLAHRARVLTVLTVCSACALGLLGAGTQYIHAYLETGRITGNAVVKEDTIAGSVLEARARATEKRTADTTAGTVGRTAALVLRGGSIVGIAGILAGLLGIAWLLLRRGRTVPERAFTFLGLAVIAQFLEFTGLADGFGYPISDWFLINQRYILHWYALVAVTLACACGLVIAWLGRRWARAGERAVLGAVTALAAALAAATVHGTWYRNHWGDDYVAKLLANVRSLEKSLPPGTRLLLEDARWNWYLGNRHLLLYSRPTRPLFLARSDAEAGQALEALGVGGVILLKSSLPGWWTDTPLLAYLQGAASQQTAPADETFAIYRIRR